MALEKIARSTQGDGLTKDIAARLEQSVTDIANALGTPFRVTVPEGWSVADNIPGATGFFDPYGEAAIGAPACRVVQVMDEILRECRDVLRLDGLGTQGRSRRRAAPNRLHSTSDRRRLRCLYSRHQLP
jgi:hypothetical protein